MPHDILLPEPNEELAPEKREALLQNLGELAAHAAPWGSPRAPEYGTGRLYRDPARLVGLVDDQGAANVGVVIDTGHRDLSSDPATAPLLVQDHLIPPAPARQPWHRDEQLLPGLGNIAWDELMKALEAAGYPGVLMYEINRMDDVVELRDNAAWVQSL